MQTQEQKDNYRCVEILHKEHNFPFEGFEIVNAMKEFGEEQFNKAIELAADLAEAIRPDYAPSPKESILKLKKSVSKRD